MSHDEIISMETLVSIFEQLHEHIKEKEIEYETELGKKTQVIEQYKSNGIDNS